MSPTRATFYTTSKKKRKKKQKRPRNDPLNSFLLALQLRILDRRSKLSSKRRRLDSRGHRSAGERETAQSPVGQGSAEGRYGKRRGIRRINRGQNNIPTDLQI